MPYIIARTIANLTAEADTDQGIRDAIRLGFQTARSAGYSPSRENLYSEVCEELREIADAEQNAEARRRLERAIEIVCEASDQSQTDIPAEE